MNYNYMKKSNETSQQLFDEMDLFAKDIPWTSLKDQPSRGGRFDPFTYERVNSGYIQIKR